MQPQPSQTGRVVLPGSERTSVIGATESGPVDPDEQAEVTVHLRSRTPDEEFQQLTSAISAKPIAERKYMSREELAQLRGADPQDIALIEQFAKSHGLTVIATDAAARTINLKGSMQALQAAFGTKLTNYVDGGKTFRERSGSLYLPAEIAPAVTGVFGLDTRPLAQPKIDRANASQ